MDDVARPNDPHGRDAMLDEALDLIDAARGDGVQLRLIGGLAVLAQCRDVGFCRRRHRDVDAVGLRRQTKAVVATLTRLGYEENRHVRLASGGRLLQAFRACRHRDDGRQAHTDDRIDVYLDTFRLHHEIPLRGRLALEPYTVPLSDVLLAKLQRTWLSGTDLRDIVGLLKDARLDEVEVAGVVGIRYLAQVCARDWGLYHDVSANLEQSAVAAAHMDLDEAARLQAAAAAGRLLDALRRERKGARWRLRALAGERLPWHDVVDENEAQRISLRERPAAGPGGALPKAGRA